MRTRKNSVFGHFSRSVNSSDLKALFTSNHEEADTKIVYCCSSFNKQCIVKAKDTNILILMIYAYAVQQPEHDWYMQKDNDSLIFQSE